MAQNLRIKWMLHLGQVSNAWLSFKQCRGINLCLSKFDLHKLGRNTRSMKIFSTQMQTMTGRGVSITAKIVNPPQLFPYQNKVFRLPPSPPLSAVFLKFSRLPILERGLLSCKLFLFIYLFIYLFIRILQSRLNFYVV